MVIIKCTCETKQVIPTKKWYVGNFCRCKIKGKSLKNEVSRIFIRRNDEAPFEEKNNIGQTKLDRYEK